MYIHTHTYIYTYIHTYLHIYTHTHTHTHTLQCYFWVYMCGIFLSLCVCVCVKREKRDRDRESTHHRQCVLRPVENGWYSTLSLSTLFLRQSVLLNTDLGHRQQAQVILLSLTLSPWLFMWVWVCRVSCSFVKHSYILSHILSLQQ
jgi:hypothetical protein